MEFEIAKAKFIQVWGTLGNSWGINRTMSQIHALLIINVEPLTTEQIMDELKVSRGNVNMNIRALMEWGLVNKELVPGERKEFFSAGKDIWQVARQIAKERRRREVEPILDVITQVKNAEGKGEKVEEFNRMMQEIEDFTSKADTTLDKFIKSDENWFYKTLLTLMK